MCRVLEVATSGYYAWRRRRQEDRPDDLRDVIQHIYQESNGTYGSPRITAELRRQGHVVNRKRVMRLMRQCGLRGASPKARRIATTDSAHSWPVAENILKRDFAATAPNQKWVGDTTFIWTKEGWLYLAVIIDLFSRKIVGWSMGPHNDQTLTQKALLMAIIQRNPQASLILHSDRGATYSSRSYRQLASGRQMVVSMSRKGDCWDNAVAESFFGTIKREHLNGINYETREQAAQDIFEYIEIYYNRKRLHSTIGHRTPAEYERDFHILNPCTL